MVGKRKRKKGDFAGGHNRCWIWGRHAVTELLRAGRWLPVEIVIADVPRHEWDSEVRRLAERDGIPLIREEPDALGKLCGARDHQGIVAKMPAFPYSSESQVLAQLTRSAAVLVLAGIQDPFNFGAILRSADLFGIEAVWVPEIGQSAVTPHVARSSAGAVNYLEIVKTSSLEESCKRLQKLDFQLLAASEKGTISPSQMDLTRRTAFVMGNEGTGIANELLTMAEAQIRIPITGHVGSLNAAVATGILCYELRRQRLPTPATETD
ncbi:MAG: RNA methyltransferase [Planctomycetaceae bacterium]|nr:RNA methyltransferase [Planctomycetaceae bacterium]